MIDHILANFSRSIYCKDSCTTSHVWATTNPKKWQIKGSRNIDADEFWNIGTGATIEARQRADEDWCPDRTSINEQASITRIDWSMMQRDGNWCHADCESAAHLKKDHPVWGWQPAWNRLYWRTKYGFGCNLAQERHPHSDFTVFFSSFWMKQI